MKLTRRHQNYLKRFKRNRKRWESFSDRNDIDRLRQIEKAYLALIIFFISSLGSCFDGLLEYSWISILSVGILGWVIFMFYDFYWVSRSIDLLIDKSKKDTEDLIDITLDQDTAAQKMQNNTQ